MPFVCCRFLKFNLLCVWVKNKSTALTSFATSTVFELWRFDPCFHNFREAYSGPLRCITFDWRERPKRGLLVLRIVWSTRRLLLGERTQLPHGLLWYTGRKTKREPGFWNSRIHNNIRWIPSKCFWTFSTPYADKRIKWINRMAPHGEPLR